MNFPLEYSEIIKRIESLSPVDYARSRNHLEGSVSYLSPYLTRGVITLPQVRDIVLEKYSPQQAEKFIQELAWREYFQKVYKEKGDHVFDDLRFTQPHYRLKGEVPQAMLTATTGITIIDTAIQHLYQHGYMHNHARMWVASMATNIAHCHWHTASRWMYYYLLDGDLASNSLSWQWVCGSFSSKQYVAHQELMNACSPKNQSQSGTYMDIPRDTILDRETPKVLTETSSLDLPIFLPESKNVVLTHENIVIFHPWNLDPLYHANENVQKILIIEPSHFQKFPVSKKVMNFIVDLARTNIPGIQVYVGEYNDLFKDFKGNIYYQYHKNVEHFTGIVEYQKELFPEVQGYHKSFFSFWKQCQKSISKKEVTR